jgi:hypothetical protein
MDNVCFILLVVAACHEYATTPSFIESLIILAKHRGNMPSLVFSV